MTMLEEEMMKLQTDIVDLQRHPWRSGEALESLWVYKHRQHILTAHFDKKISMPLHIHAIIESANHMKTAEGIKSCRNS